MTGTLDGLLVLDFSTLLPGPMASLFLADAGAEVLKVEPPGGENMRRYEPRWGEESVNFAILNKGKKSLAIDLKDPSQRRRLDPLLRRADVVIEQFRPGVMQRLGLGYQDIRALNGDVIYCSITGYGQTGPKSQRAGHDLNYIGDAGVLSLSMGNADWPTVPPALMADIAGGAYPAVINILLALRARDAGQGGSHLDLSMAENMFPFLFWAMGAGQVSGQWPGNSDALLTGGSPRYRIYPTSDGRFLAAAPLEDKFWAMFCEAIGLEQPLRDDRRDPARTATRVAQIIAAAPSTHWGKVFQSVDCCCSIVRSVEEALADPHFKARRLFDRLLENDGGDRITALPLPIVPEFSAGIGRAADAPRLGAHNAEIPGERPNDAAPVPDTAPDGDGDVEIRAGRIEDAPAIAAMIARLAAETGGRVVPKTTTEVVIEHGFSTAPSFETMVAIHHGEPIGLCLFSQTFSSWRGVPGLYVIDLYVAPDARGRALGRRLLAATARAGRNRGCAFLKLEVDERNAPALEFYRALGFDCLTEDRLQILDGDAFVTLRDG